ncbi:MAG: trypsin-like peptidase domain-containing protein [Lacipirellulaceae bacterium]
MSASSPRLTTAGERETGTVCAACSADINLGDAVALCGDCGSIHHASCWNESNSCRAYQCSPGKLTGNNSGQVPITVTPLDLSEATPLPTAPKRVSTQELLKQLDEQPKAWNRLAIWAFGIALAGIPLFGIITGVIAMIIACVALVSHSQRKRGLGLAVAAMLLGLVDVVGWSFGLAYFYGDKAAHVSLDELVIDPESLDELPQHLARAMRANVLISSDRGFGRGGFGSGVILKIDDGKALIVTNRHVIDANYSDSTQNAPEDLSDLAEVAITVVSQTTIPAVVEWVAPHGVDLAILSARVSSPEVRAARWLDHAKPKIGDMIFAVGNPHGLGWTHSEGSVSQVRRQRKGAFDYRILQSTAAINPGNSGGGLYNEQGQLIGINTMTGDKRVAEGLGFSIDFQTLLDLVPRWLALPEQEENNDVLSDSDS